MTGGTNFRIALAAALAAGLLTACSDGPSLPRIGDLNPFAEKEKPLPGKRVPVALAESKAGLQVAAADKPIVLPAARVNDSWPQPGGTANNSPGHVALGGTVRQAWSADAGAGSSSYGRLTASPIVADGKIFVLDTNGRVSAFTLAGSSAWRVSLTPAKEKDYKGFGGGLAAESGRIFAATGFGYVYALETGTGKKLWERNVNSPIRSSPTVAGDRLFVVTSDGTAMALSTSDGRDLWTHQGLPEKAAILSNASPAVEGDFVVVPYPSGELVALRIADGQPTWTESLARTRLASSLGSMTDAGRPVVDGGTVYGVGHSGRMVATGLKSGERIWSLNVPGIQAPAVAGEFVYVVDTGGSLMAITRRDGKVLWTTKLPGASTWSGPTLAGNKLWLTSNTGQLIGVDASTGKPDTPQAIGAPTYIAPVVAGGKLFVLTDKARLIAFQ
ncbi:MAG: PQQ-binding-like beta-propeller repeat protein [Hyphomicrobiaceae bacterium]